MVKKSSVRNLTKTLAVVSLLAPVSGHTLGIGEITLHSALNQKLNAEISLVLSGENVSDIKVKLAPPEKFDEAGVSWTYFLSKIKFETMTQSNGSAIIKLTSNEALKEPFLDFLLEVSWPKGNLYRGFTVLVDPPSAYNPATFPVSTRTESYAQASVVTPQSQAYANGQSSEGDYGPTLSNDTLWSVAERTRGQGDVSVEQMMIAIYQANPHAFNKGNAHGLTAGKMLKIPERGVVLKLSRNQALAEFNRQTKAWKKRSAPASGDKEKAKPDLQVSVDNQLTLAAPAKHAVADHAVITSVNESEDSDKDTADHQSEVVKGNHAEGNVSAAVSADGALQSKISGLEKQLAMMQELIALKDQQFAALQKQSLANPAAQQQVLPGEAVVAARLENQTMTTPQQTVVQPVEAPQPVPGEMVTAKPVDQITPVSQPIIVQSAEAVKPLVQPEPETSNLLDTYYLVVGSAGTAILTLLGWLWWRKRKVDEETNTESMFASTIMVDASAVDENISVPIVETSPAVQDNDTGIVGESSFLSEFTPSDFDSFDTDQAEIDPISEADVYLAYGRYQQAEELIRQAIKDQPDRDECKLKLLEIFYANENKADFEAYAAELAKMGKRNEAEFWEKAAEMGREICPDSPLFSSGDELFAMVEDEVVDSTGDSITANNALNRERVMTGAVSFINSEDDAFVKEATELKSDTLDFDLTSSDEVKDDVIAGTQRNNEDIDFDLSSFSLDTNTSNETEKNAIDPRVQIDALSTEQVEDINFDLSPFSIEFDGADQGVIAPNTITSGSLRATSESIDFDLSSFSIESDNGVIAPNTQAGSLSVAPIEDFDLSSFSLDANETDKTDQDFTGSDALLSFLPEVSVDKYDAHDFDFSFDHAETKEVDSLDFSALESNDSLSFDDELDGDFDFNFDLDLAPTPTPTRKDQDSGQHEEFGVSALTDRDALETKLDLAKAYVDMGDADAAKDLAREVLDQGTVEQKNIAQTLLDELG